MDWVQVTGAIPMEMPLLLSIYHAAATTFEAAVNPEISLGMSLEVAVGLPKFASVTMGVCWR